MIALLLLVAGCEMFRLPPDREWQGDYDEDGWDFGDDCNDMSDDVYPGAPEACDGVDNNCERDEEDAEDRLVWYPDIDGDGYGDDAQAYGACEAPRGWVLNGGDCDDDDPDVNPAAPEPCDESVDRNCDGRVAWSDGDGDGTAACMDCNDADPLSFPGAEEICDGFDQDCDGDVDDGAEDLTWYIDRDGDGFGDVEQAMASCTRPVGWVLDATDCDDGDAARHPSAGEACNGLDDDCDDEIDEYELSGNDRWYVDADADGYGTGDGVVGCTPVDGLVSLDGDCDDADATLNPSTVWSRDSDADGFGNAGLQRVQCAALVGYVRDGTDCDDRRGATYPGADEYCNGADDDCDTTVDEDDAVDAPTWYPDLDADGWGDPLAPTPACDVPAGCLADASDCDDADAGSYPRAPEPDCDDPVDHNCDGSVGHADADADGAEACADCDDSRADIGPDADETCDGEDDDCDAETDEDDAVDALPWYADADADGYGDAAFPTWACYAGVGVSADATDCDDADAAVNPGAAEDCATTADDDCDGASDAEGATGCLDWYTDVDLDGWGGGTATCLCEAPSGGVAGDGDCDDADATVNPDATEVCGDGVDQDCATAGCGWDGEIGVADAHAVVQGRRSADQTGWAVASAGDLDGDGYAEVLVGAPGLDEAGSASGAALLFAGPIAGTLDADDALAVFAGEAAGAYAGTALDRAWDVDADGAPDLVVGSYNYGSYAGAAYVVAADQAGVVALADGAAWDAVATGDYAGWAVAGASDVDGDGYDDVLVGAPFESTSSGGAGAAYLLAGPMTGRASLTSAAATLLGEDNGDYAGATLAGGEDLDGDGLADVVMGAYFHDLAGVAYGSVYVYYGPVSGTVDASLADARIDGEQTVDRVGAALALGDADGDGVSDLAVSSFFGADDHGRVMVFGAPLGTLSSADAFALVPGTTVQDQLGRTIALPDMDGDGIADLVAGAYLAAEGSVGGAYRFDGPLSGTLTGDDADAVLIGSSSATSLGARVGRAGDVDGDGLEDVLLGDVSWDTPYSNAGGAFLFLGGEGE